MKQIFFILLSIISISAFAVEKDLSETDLDQILGIYPDEMDEYPAATELDLQNLICSFDKVGFIQDTSTNADAANYTSCTAYKGTTKIEKAGVDAATLMEILQNYSEATEYPGSRVVEVKQIFIHIDKLAMTFTGRVVTY